MVILCEASVSARSSTSMGVLRSASLLLGIRGKALDVESSTQGPGKTGSCSHVEISVGARCSPCRAPAVSASGLSVSGSGALCRGPALSVFVAHIRCHGPPAQNPSSPARSLFPGEKPKSYCLGDQISQQQPRKRAHGPHTIFGLQNSIGWI